MERRYCIIGAGYSGLAAAKAFADLGLDYDHIEATGRVGGNWSHGVYDSTHLISSKKTTQYADYPMPAHYPDFPSAAQMLAYLTDFAEHFALTRRIEFDRTVTSVEPLDAVGKAGWSVEFDDGETRKYAGVVVANGHYWQPFIPEHPGAFAGKQLHSKAYKNPGDLVGDRILVVGGGNSACDLAVEAANAHGTSDLSMRRGYWFLPKYVLGIPTSELDVLSVPVPRVLESAIYRAIIRVGFGKFSDFGLPKPDHGVLDQDVVVNSLLPYYLKHGRVRPRPGIDHFDGHDVHFTDGSVGTYDTIVWATGFTTSFPFLPDGLLEWENGQPRLIDHVIPPGLANLYVFGLVAPRSGAGSLLTRSGQLLARIVLLQERVDTPIADYVGRISKPEACIRAGGPDLRWQIVRSTPVVSALTRIAPLLPSRKDAS